MTGKLLNKVAIVTGAAKGIGRAIAHRYAMEGAKVVVADIDANGSQTVADEIVAMEGVALSVPTDISSKESVDQLFDQTLEAFGTVDILVNNAGLISPMIHFLEADYEWWNRIISVNLTGTFLCCHRAAHIMARNGGGSIINMSSGGATRAHRAFAAYDASKGGIEAFTRALALDLGPYNIRVNSLVPGSIDTTGMDEDARKLRGINIPIGRVGESNDMAGPAVFLASDDASYITGHAVTVDGGMLAQQRSATVDIHPPTKFPKLEDFLK